LLPWIPWNLDRYLNVEIPSGLRSGSSERRTFNFPLNDSFALDIVSHLLHTAAFTLLVGVGESYLLEAMVAVFFVVPEAADIIIGGNQFLSE
jgi:hypothetical protein